MSAVTCISGIVWWGGGPPSHSIAGRMARAGGGGSDFDRVIESESAIFTASGLGSRTRDGTNGERARREDVGTEPGARPAVRVVADARIDEVDGHFRRGPGERNPEVILGEAYARWGCAFAERLVGDYAFALWDGAERRLIAARDPMGMRTLYYVRDENRLLFASRIEQLLAAGAEPTLFEPAVAAYLAGPRGRPEWTFLAGIEQLAPGKVLIAEEGRVRVVDGPSIVPEGTLRLRDDSEYERRFRELFVRAVEDRIPSEGRTGFFLSSGTDSGAMASTAGWLREQGRVRGELASYSFAFRRFPDCDERAVSGRITQRYGLEARDVPGDEGWPLSGLDGFEPNLADPYFSPHHPLFAAGVELAARDGTDVMMMGTRGDEIVGDAITDLPGMARSFRLLGLLRELRALGGGSPRRFLRVVRRDLLRPWKLEGVGNGDPFDFTPRVPPWVRSDFARRVGLEDILKEGAGEWTFRQVSREQRHRRIRMFAGHRIVGWLRTLHRQNDIEFVDPWSDVRLSRYILSIPQHLVNRAAEPKRIVRRAMRGIYPDSALAGAGKVIPDSLFDFGIECGGRDVIEDLLTDSQAEARGFMDASEVRRAWEEYVKTGRAPFDFWWPITLELWLRTHWS